MTMFPTLKLTRVEDLMPSPETKAKNKSSPFIMVRSDDGESKFIRNRHYDHKKGRYCTTVVMCMLCVFNDTGLQ